MKGRERGRRGIDELCMRGRRTCLCFGFVAIQVLERY